MKSFKAFLLEGNMSGNYYHVISNPKHVAQILRLQYIPMSFSGTSAEGLINKEYPYYLSVSRVPSNSFRGNSSLVTLVLDANKINQAFKVVPTSYYNFISRLDRNEAEDRILSNRSKLSTKYLKEVHVFAPEKNVKEYPNWYNSFYSNDSGDNIAFYMYEDKNPYNLLDKRKAISYDEFREKYEKLLSYDFGGSDERDLDDLINMVDLLMKGGKNPETERQKYWIRNYLRSWGRHDFIPHFSNIIHNSHRKKSNLGIQRELQHLARYMKTEFGTTNVNNFLKLWFDKYVS